MNKQRKEIIISEIKYWKKSKLLPAHYCDFLITLYGQGDEGHGPELDGSKSILLKEKKQLNMKFVLIALIAAAVCTSLFVAVKYPVITFSLSATLVFLFLFHAMRSSMTKSKVIPFLYIVSAFTLLMMSLKLWLVFFEGQTMLLIALLILNCALWLFAGRLLKLLYFTISGAAGIVLILAFLFFQS